MSGVGAVLLLFRRGLFFCCAPPQVDRLADQLELERGRHAAQLASERERWETEREQQAGALGGTLQRQLERVEQELQREAQAREFWQQECAAIEEKRDILEAKLAGALLTSEAHGCIHCGTPCARCLPSTAPPQTPAPPEPPRSEYGRPAEGLQGPVEAVRDEDDEDFRARSDPAGAASPGGCLRLLAASPDEDAEAVAEVELRLAQLPEEPRARVHGIVVAIAQKIRGFLGSQGGSEKALAFYQFLPEQGFFTNRIGDKHWMRNAKNRKTAASTEMFLVRQGAALDAPAPDVAEAVAEEEGDIRDQGAQRPSIRNGALAETQAGAGQTEQAALIWGTTRAAGATFFWLLTRCVINVALTSGFGVVLLTCCHFIDCMYFGFPNGSASNVTAEPAGFIGIAFTYFLRTPWQTTAVYRAMSFRARSTARGLGGLFFVTRLVQNDVPTLALTMWAYARTRGHAFLSRAGLCRKSDHIMPDGAFDGHCVQCEFDRQFDTCAEADDHLPVIARCTATMTRTAGEKPVVNASCGECTQVRMAHRGDGPYGGLMEKTPSDWEIEDSGGIASSLGAIAPDLAKALAAVLSLGGAPAATAAAVRATGTLQRAPPASGAECGRQRSRPILPVFPWAPLCLQKGVQDKSGHAWTVLGATV
ncbi:unnamed protein product [Prorocentrum cordatum]|uniref:Uncharacterized protein n=1 Tax=Prorocentrum cordatum TaxID=2364126 RepID=A0ABN9V071_9DINO|nr:unnamed protein product [Polarella glacialis]